MALPERQEAMDQLKRNKKVEVILISTRAGGVGLNLTTACRAYLVDPYWSVGVGLIEHRILMKQESCRRSASH
jgi:SNF2 family DNA or RNA helicase